MRDATEPTTLEEAKKVIARQEEELRRLRQRVEDDRFAEDLRDVLVLTAASGLPLGHGIAGLVAATGQPTAASNVQDEHRLVEEIGDTLGYEPQSVMAAPLCYGDRVVGVLELLDKEADTSFSASDLHALALFGHQAAVALELSRRYRHLAPLVAEILASVDDQHGPRKLALRERSDAFASYIEDEPSYAKTLELAELVQLIAWEGDDELVACRTIPRAFADYLRSRPAPLSGVRSS